MCGCFKSNHLTKLTEVLKMELNVFFMSQLWVYFKLFLCHLTICCDYFGQKCHFYIQTECIIFPFSNICIYLYVFLSYYKIWIWIWIWLFFVFFLLPTWLFCCGLVIYKLNHCNAVSDVHKTKLKLLFSHKYCLTKKGSFWIFLFFLF